ncbi:MAG: hypothetical protein E6614_05890 [Bradyrhizobium sp.]|jgi:hypothetical protein|uniref:Uncharacterized protein n=1 Tax=Bradyrhizobium denitrificans TaxID=2734912 RepID=A0ABS5G1R1_9BRAD|nr:MULTISPECIES: hypothetical protein [Bradyrhizobium]MDU6255121.1 hypothetical protein [Staphylococcus warneri]MBR1135160.1 hypothetical protein [Bradyrhizobium denitrificans]MDU0955409.1 hypothetical protein [Bradyrhizobium sp.]MDU1494046.1 hypothetical protein [Bradyrhizobium sp.]MDU1544204.1 hypothetical protein [Bradyrhizobium sp.]
MIIEVTDGRCRLVDAGNFRALKITSPRSLSQAALVSALAGVGSLVSQTDALINPDALRRLAGPGVGADWNVKFDTMLRQAGTSGWIDEASGAIKVHVELV